ncbi:MAG: GTP-binding protein, partial [Candidatus Lokiarchaeota archaeon]|nr:GTP-binding protein [Candidatus Lokiarchaeota archaeon]
MSNNLEKLQVLLKWYKQEVGKDLNAAFVLDREGLVVDFIVRPTVKAIEDFVEDIRDLMGLILKKIAEDFTLGSFGAGTFDTIKYRFIFCEAGPQHIFVTILDAMAIAEPVFAYAYLAAEKIARIFDGRPVSPVIPKIYSDEKPISIQRKVNKLQKLRIPLADYVYKIILGGEGAVGKTSLIQRFVEGVFRTDYKATIGTSITKKQCSFEGINNTVRFVIWDLAGQPQFHRIRHNYYTNAEAGLLVFDITRRDTFEMIKKWYFEIKKDASPDIILILVGNKTDLKDSRTVSTTEAEELAKELGVSYIETSAITGENINDAFKMLALHLIKRFMEAIEVTEIRNGISPRPDQINGISQAQITPNKSELSEHKRYSLSDVWKGNEEDFISWVEKNLDLVTESLNIDLIPIERESNNQGTNYILAEDKFGTKVVVFLQLGQTNNDNLARVISLLDERDAYKAIWICEKTLFEHEKIIEWFNNNT